MATDGSYLSSRFPASSRRLAGFSLIVVVLTVGAVATLLRLPAHSLRLSACFQDVNGLRSGASVRIAGVDVGVVRTVRAHPGNSACPAEVGMELATDYALNVPNDAVASVGSTGILGASFVTIETTRASGPTLSSGGQIRSREDTPLAGANLERIVEKFLDDMKDKSDEQKSAVPCSQAAAGTRSLSPKPHPN